MENPVAAEGNNNSQPAPPASSGLQLEEALLKQVEYYFSRQNLANDAYLVSQMDADMWVSLDVIAKFKKVSMITTDIDFIARVMSRSPNVNVDAQKKLIKPSWKLERTTIILRDIASDAPQEEVRALFGDKFNITNVHSDVGDTWFVTFDKEDTAVDAMLFVRNQKFRGKEVKARVKSEHLLKTAYTPAAAPTNTATSAGGAPQYTPMQYPVYPQYPQQGQYWQQGYDGQRPYRGGPRPSSQYYNSQPNNYNKDGRVKTTGPTTAPQVAQPSGVPQGDANNKIPQMTTQHFPPLARQRAGSFKTGYSKDFKKYSRDDIIRVIQAVTDVSNPELLPAAKESGVVAKAPNTTLEVTSAPAVEAAPESTGDAAATATPAAGDDNTSAPVGEALQHLRIDAIEKSTQTSAPSSPNPNVSTTKTIPKVPSYADIALAASRSSPPTPHHSQQQQSQQPPQQQPQQQSPSSPSRSKTVVA